MIRVVLLALIAASCAACGPKPKVQVKTIAVEDGPVLGPKASAEETDGKVPPLKGIAKSKLLVPEKLVPPEPPSDPSFGPKE